jgi:replicative DNA helicase
MKTETPHSPEAERSVLGALLIKNDAFDQIADKLSPEHFHDKRNAGIYAAIQNLAGKGDPFDSVTLSEWLESSTNTSAWLPALGKMARSVPSAANINAYADIVRDKAIQRRVIAVADEIKALALSGKGDADSLMDAASRGLMEIPVSVSDDPIPVRQVLSTVIDTIDQRNQGILPVSIKSGFYDLDHLITGFNPGDLIILAARPSMGKTALAMNIAENASISGKRAVVVFSMEQPREQLVERMLSSLGHIDHDLIRTGKLEGDDWRRLTSAVSLLDENPLHIDDGSSLTIHALCAKARRMKRQHDIGLVIVDYLQLMRGEGYNRTDEIGRISMGLKALAKELHVPVVALSQLNRSSANRENKQPQLSDLRDSGQIEQDADLVLFIHRPVVLDPDTPHKDVAFITLAKHRNGPTGKINLTFRGQFCRFENYSGEVIEFNDLPAMKKRGFED